MLSCILGTMLYFSEEIVHMVKVLIMIYNWTGSCCALFVLNNWNVTKQSPVNNFMSLATNKYPCVLEARKITRQRQ